MDNPQTFRGRLAELSPFEITVSEAPEAPVWPKVSTDNVSAEELYGCVDWYQYPGQTEREPENKVRPLWRSISRSGIGPKS
jgi:hypothetical protein